VIRGSEINIYERKQKDIDDVLGYIILSHCGFMLVILICTRQKGSVVVWGDSTAGTASCVAAEVMVVRGVKLWIVVAILIM